MTNLPDKMNNMNKALDVLIVGAGLSGLMMAAQLLRHGVYPTIIDEKLGPDRRNEPVHLHARTMELLHQLELDEPVMQKGSRKTRLDMPGGKAFVDLQQLTGPDTFFPEIWALPSAELEKIVIAHLTSRACKIFWGTRLSALTETGPAVAVEVLLHGDRQDSSGSRETWTADWVVGADGVESTVRTALGLAGEGSRPQAVSRFSSRRCFLVGDAARPGLSGAAEPVPVNAGFLDTWNLGWKLAGVLSGRIDRRILFSYHEERCPSAKGNGGGLAEHWPGGALFRLHQWAPGLIGKRLPSVLSRWIQARPSRLARVFRAYSGLALSYRGSPIAVHYSQSERIRAGDRFPSHVLFDEKAKSPTDTRQIFLRPGFVLVIMGNVGSHMIHVLGQWIKQKYPQGLGLYYIPYSPRNRAIFDHFDMPADAVQTILVRPDTYIAYMTASVNTFLIDHYLEAVIGWKPYKQFD